MNKMLVGIDLDNTILDYSIVLIKMAEFLNLKVPVSGYDKAVFKTSVISEFSESHWTKLQALIYGPMSLEARIFPGFPEFIELISKKGWDYSIISHRSVLAAGDTSIKLQEYAKLAISRILKGVIDEDKIFFGCSFEQKIRIITDQRCDIFIDDLQSVVDELSYSKHDIFTVQFDPSVNIVNVRPTGARIGNWFGVASIIEEMTWSKKC